MKLTSALELFLLVDRSPVTNRDYAKKVQLFIDFVGDRDIVTIEDVDIERWIRSMREQKVLYVDHPKREEMPGELSPATIESRFKTVKAFFNYLVKRRKLDISPVKEVKIKKYRKSPVESKAMTREDLEAMLNATKKTRNRAALMFTVGTGCRARGLCSLRLSHLDLKGGTALLIEKGDNPHKVYFGRKVREILIAWLKDRPSVAHDHVFTSERDKGPLTPRAFYQVCRRIAKRAGVEGRYNPHSIRHLVGQTLADEKVPVTLAQEILGHKDPDTTYSFYYNQTPERLKKVAENLLDTILKE